MKHDRSQKVKVIKHDLIQKGREPMKHDLSRKAEKRQNIILAKSPDKP